jgi:UDP-N-acetylmuramyl pentapeptide phosphotransferase/UDP-N-acetylglucosamine-1-phosphate transferase
MRRCATTTKTRRYVRKTLLISRDLLRPGGSEFSIGARAFSSGTDSSTRVGDGALCYPGNVPGFACSTVLAGAFLASLGLCELIRRFAARRALLDAPNDRSLHTTPTPRLGGVAIVIATLLALVFVPTSHTVWFLAATTTALSIVGLTDDVRPLGASVRFVLQVAIVSAFVWFEAPATFLILPGWSLMMPRAIIIALCVVWSVGTLNIYNFMDGMDGLAGAEAIATSLVVALLFASVDAPDLGVFSVLIAGATAGFLMHNFPPARIFMGDAGSTFLGLSLASLAVAGMSHGLALAVSALPLSPFLLDGTFTILRRALRREPIWRAHRSHLYQRAVQTGLEHRDVLLVYVPWMVFAGAMTVIAQRSPVACVVAWGLSLTALLAVWRWVVARESQQALTS